MNHEIDNLTQIRRKYWPKIDDLKQEYGSGRGVYELSEDERVGVIEKPVQDVYALLREAGLKREPVAALKTRHDGRPSAGSWKFIPEHDREKQVHVTLFALSDGTEINAHYEYRWEPWTPHWDWGRPDKHYFPAKVYDLEKGEELLLERFDKHNIQLDKQ